MRLWNTFVYFLVGLVFAGGWLALACGWETKLWLGEGSGWQGNLETTDLSSKVIDHCLMTWYLETG
jgi:hypothetical protein